MSGQWEDGRVPHILFHDRNADYFPGPDFWETEWTTSISQPPVWATCVRRMVEITGDDTRLAALVPKMDASHRWFHDARDPLGVGAIAVAHPWESGLDNCPVWDAPMRRVDTSNAPSFVRRDTHVVGDVDQRPTDEQYVQYACIVKAIARDGFGIGPFAVYDPLITAILARAEEDLAWLADRAGQQTGAAQRAKKLRAGLVGHLWNEELGRFVYHDARADELITADVIGGYAPLFAGLDQERAERLRAGLKERFEAKFPYPSTSPLDPAFEARRYWRGPTWINTNWLLVDAMGEELAQKTVDLVREGGFYEYFDAETGDGLGGESFTWSAALCLDLVARGDAH
jgi:glycogen debranching enzyme